MAIQMHPSLRIPAGVWLKEEIVEPYGFTVTGVADHLKVSRQNMSALLNGKTGLSAEMAIRFEKAFGIKADTLMRMQSAYELAQARGHEDEIDVKRVPEPA